MLGLKKQISIISIGTSGRLPLRVPCPVSEQKWRKPLQARNAISTNILHYLILNYLIFTTESKAACLSLFLSTAVNAFLPGCAPDWTAPSVSCKLYETSHLSTWIHRNTHNFPGGDEIDQQFPLTPWFVLRRRSGCFLERKLIRSVACNRMGDSQSLPLTGTFILNSSLLNLNKMSDSVRCSRAVGRSTRTSCRFPGNEPCNKTEKQPITALMPQMPPIRFRAPESERQSTTHSWASLYSTSATCLYMNLCSPMRWSILGNTCSITYLLQPKPENVGLPHNTKHIHRILMLLLNLVY